MEQIQPYLTTIISALVSIYIQVDDDGLRIALSLIVTNMIILLIKNIDGSRITSLIARFQYNNITIHSNTFKYRNVIKYLRNEYGKYIKSICIENTDDSDIKKINNFSTKNIKINYNNNTMFISIYDNKICVSSKASVIIIEAFINHISNDNSEKIITIYHAAKKISKSDDNNHNSNKNTSVYWDRSDSITNKTLENTILDEKNHKELFGDIESFMNKERYYYKVGQPFKRGYLIHGIPGCGKTSIIKAIAANYRLPVFVIDLSITKNNNELTKLINSINSYVGNNKHMVIYEDIDRTTFFAEKYRTELTMNCLLNILDGVDEAYGRITVMTANNISNIVSNDALIRPGRIDKIVELSFCTDVQLSQIMKLYYDKEFNIVNSIKITPAKVIQYIQQHDDPQKVIDFLQNKDNNIEDNSIKNPKVNIRARNKIPTINKITIKRRQLKKMESKIKHIDFNSLSKLEKLDHIINKAKHEKIKFEIDKLNLKK